ncbi:MAG: glycosyltransferase family 2 protein [Acidobacteriota bacterium]|nr:glycosyltransferase family 2 protein [Acidobacteriota bacterium]
MARDRSPSQPRPAPAPAPVAVCIVTYGAAADLPECVASLRALTPPVAEITVVDCASADDSVAVSRGLAVDFRGEEGAGTSFRVVALEENLGFAGGMNRALAETAAPFVLSLNADARPRPGFVQRLLARLETHPDAGAVTGRLLRPEQPGEPRRLDACGMRLIPTWRHLDRGSGEVDRGQFAEPEKVFGATGAATLYRRAALEDAAVDGEVFDAAFHSFREDAELSFRLRERGWEILYEPTAVAVHKRWNLPERRSAMPAMVNYHSLKNRYLLRCYHQTGRNLLLTLLPTLLRDILALGYVLLRERSSFEAYRWLWRHRRRIAQRRRHIQRRRKVGSASIDRWFHTSGEPL